MGVHHQNDMIELLLTRDGDHQILASLLVPISED